MHGAKVGIKRLVDDISQCIQFTCSRQADDDQRRKRRFDIIGTSEGRRRSPREDVGITSSFGRRGRVCTRKQGDARRNVTTPRSDDTVNLMNASLMMKTVNGCCRALQRHPSVWPKMTSRVLLAKHGLRSNKCIVL